MFTNITWAEYITFVVSLSTFYYLFVVIKFYKNDILLLISRLSKSFNHAGAGNNEPQTEQSKLFKSATKQPELFEHERAYAPSPEEVDDTFVKIQALTTELKTLVRDAATKHYIKDEFILSIQLLLKKHHYLKGSPFVVPINNLIVFESEKYGYIKLNAEECMRVWSE